MTKQVQRRRGTATQHTSFTGAEGEISVNTTNKSVHVHDGTTAGGIEAARADMTNVTDANLNARLNGNTLSSLTITSADINGGTIDGTVIGGTTPAAVTGTTITGTSFATTGNMTFGDNDKAIFGAGSDLQIYHTGSQNYIEDAGTGNLNFKSNGNNFNFLDGSDNLVMKIDIDSETTLYHNTSAKLATTSTGVDVSGTITSDGLTVDGNITATGGDLNLATLDLNAIAATKAVTAVDVFVYDTSKDSDGGAWRKRTQHTSWYNETLNTATRGSRREFPAVAVIVAETSKLTIYDGDDPSLPMWMVFNRPTSFIVTLLWAWSTVNATAVAALNGTLAFASTGSSRFKTVNFIDEVSYQWDILQSYKGNVPISERDTSWTNIVPITGTVLSRELNDVAMTVLPDAPIDTATGLPVPTIAVATAGGVSVIKDDGTVVDSATTLGIGRLFFDGLGGIFYKRNTTTGIFWYSTKDDYTAGDGFGDEVARTTAGTNSFDILAYDSLVDNLTSMDGGLASGGSTPTSQAVSGLMLHQPNYTDQSKGMSALLTSTYNTGWMNGDIKGAFLSDTDDTDLVGGEYVVDGGFDDPTKWTASDGSTVSGGVLNVADGTINEVIYNSGGSHFPKDKVAVISFDINNIDANFGVRLCLVNPTTGAVMSTLGGTYYTLSGSYTFTVTETPVVDWVVGFQRISTHTGTLEIDNVSIKLADADRSVNNNGLIVNGTVTRTAVATGADLVAYSGFNSSNYLEQPYNSGLDFGTGDFCVMGWVTYVSGGHVFERIKADDTGNYIRIVKSGGVLTARAYASSASTVSGTRNINDGSYHHFAYIRSGGVESLYVDGSLDASVSQTADNISANDQVLFVGVDGALGSPDTGSLALFRISATAPTAEQIKKIYEDEKVLFQEGAQATLYGSSDAVTALAHDSDTGLLHVGTSAGRSVFQGLRRVSNTTTAVGTAISASNGLVVEE
jgi:hypothetical protein